MKVSVKSRANQVVRRAAFTLVEVMVASAVMGTVIVSIYGGLTAGFALTTLIGQCEYWRIDAGVEQETELE